MILGHESGEFCRTLIDNEVLIREEFDIYDGIIKFISSTFTKNNSILMFGVELLLPNPPSANGYCKDDIKTRAIFTLIDDIDTTKPIPRYCGNSYYSTDFIDKFCETPSDAEAIRWLVRTFIAYVSDTDISEWFEKMSIIHGSTPAILSKGERILM